MFPRMSVHFTLLLHLLAFLIKQQKNLKLLWRRKERDRAKRTRKTTYSHFQADMLNKLLLSEKNPHRKVRTVWNNLTRGDGKIPK
jgi:hypothetical protein